MQYKIGDIIRIINDEKEVLSGQYLIVKTKIENPNELQISNLTGKHNILNINSHLKNYKCIIKDYIAIEIFPSPYPVNLDKVNILNISEKNIL